jgi:hypothetical protein
MTNKGMLLSMLYDLGIREPDEITNIDEDDKEKNRLIWKLPKGMFIFDVIYVEKVLAINYLYDVEDEPIKIGTMSNFDTAVVYALKYLR